MFTYYLCDDNNTIYRLEFSIKPEEREKYLSLLDNYLNELVFLEEKEFKKLIEKSEMENEELDSISIKNDQLLLERQGVSHTEKIEDYLPLIATIKIKEYSFLRSYTICILINLLSDDMIHFSNPLAKKIIGLHNQLQNWYVDFSRIYEFFFTKTEQFLGEKYFDYNSLKDLLKSLNINITERYSANELKNFWAGDDAERTLADSIVEGAILNKKILERISFDFLDFDEKIRTRMP